MEIRKIIGDGFEDIENDETDEMAPSEFRSTLMQLPQIRKIEI
jgi:hypothetical protein